LTKRPYRRLLRILALVSVAAALVCMAVLFWLPGWRAAALSALAGLLSGWLAVGVAVKKRGRPLKTIFWQTCLLSALMLAWDRAGGWRGWSVDFALPILYICTMIAMAAVARVLRLRPSEYLMYLVLDILLGLFPLVLLLLGAVQVICPSAICAAVSVLLLAGLILFEGPALRGELARRSHL